MDKNTAQALHDLATSGRLSDGSQAAVYDALGVQVDDESGLVGPKADKAPKADDGKAAAKP